MNDQQLSHLLWLLPSGIATFALAFLRDLARSVAKLNENIAILVTKVADHDKKLDDHETRIRDVEDPETKAAS